MWAALLFGLAPSAAYAATITVNDDGDVTADDGNCTLREAIEAANDNLASGAMADECDAGELGPAIRDVIDFDLGMGSHVISPVGSDLPVITEQVEIDGRNGTMIPRIQIDGSAAGAGGTGLFTTTGSDGSYVHDLAIYGFTSDGLNLFSDSNTAERMISGTDLDGTASTLGNDSDGIQVSGNDTVLDTVVASANGANGILVDARADGTTITNSRIGTTRDGTGDLGNGLSGIRASSNSLDGPDQLTIGGMTGLTPGGACTGDCNVISGNGSQGIDLLAAALPITGVEIQGNHIGIDDAGTLDLGNGFAGIVLQADVEGTVIRDNVISGNTGDGVVLSPSSSVGVTEGPSSTVIAGNRIGVETTGATALENGDRGVQMASDVTSAFDPIAGTVIGGTAGLTPGGACSGDCNVISGNGTFGVDLFGNVDGTQVLGNHIGTDLAGSTAVANQQSGVSVAETEGNQIGTPGAGNVISGNVNNGVQVNNVPGGNTIQANVIGAQSNGAGAVPNGGAGVSLLSEAIETLVGGAGAGEGNLVAHNAEAGVEVAGGVTPATANAVLGNSIFSNTGLAIDLGALLGGADGVTPNDGPGDADTGGNGLQNAPELTAAVVGGSTTILGKLDSAASTTFRIELFENNAGDPTGFGEGETLLGSFEATTDAAGAASFAETLAGTAGAGATVSATATELDSQGDPLGTSEFAENILEGCDVTGTAAAETVTGTAAAEVICGFGGDDLIVPGGGDDVVLGGSGDDRLDLSDATATVTVDLAVLTASTGADDLLLADVEDATGGSAADTLTGHAGGNELAGGPGNDTVDGGEGNDTLTGGGGDDDVVGAAGDDFLSGQGGKDELTGGNDEDVMFGGEGADTLKGQAAVDSIQGQNGTDELLGGTGADLITGGANADSIQGQDGGDDLKGQDADDEITGGANADDLEGGDGNDDLKGQADKDSLNGGSGSKDVCDGGGDNDVLSAPGCETRLSIP